MRDFRPPGTSWTLQTYSRARDTRVDVQVTTINPGERLVVGRSSRSDVTVPDLRMSAQHFCVSCDDPTRLILTDLSSTNGTTVDSFELRDAATLVERSVLVRAGRSLFVLAPPTSCVAPALGPLLVATPDQDIPLGVDDHGAPMSFGSGERALQVELATTDGRDQLGQSVLVALLVRASGWDTDRDIRVFVAGENLIPDPTVSLPLVDERAIDAASFLRLEDLLVDITAGRTAVDGRVLLCVGTLGEPRRMLEMIRLLVSIGGRVLWICAAGDSPAGAEFSLRTTFGAPVRMSEEHAVNVGVPQARGALFTGLARVLAADSP